MYDIVNTESIILLERIEKEHDKSFFVFSRELGLISIYATSVLKVGAKLNSILQPYRFIQSDIVVGKSKNRVTTARHSLSFEDILKDKNKKETFSSATNFLSKVLPKNISSSEIYDLYKEFILSILNTKKKEEILYFESIFIYKILIILGYEGKDISLVKDLNDVDKFENNKEILDRINSIFKEINV
jgi:recombinational DNA repair protein (RecF pathway)